VNHWSNVLCDKTLNSDCYVRNILEPLFEQLTDDDSMATFNRIVLLCILHKIMTALQYVFSAGLWPPRLPDLSFCDFCLWGTYEGKCTGTYLALLNHIEHFL
jgi:hypothetical protein